MKEMGLDAGSCAPLFALAEHKLRQFDSRSQELETGNPTNLLARTNPAIR
jgi:hypothetical protein